jgi:hypothetical protein
VTLTGFSCLSTCLLLGLNSYWVWKTIWFCLLEFVYFLSFSCLKKNEYVINGVKLIVNEGSKLRYVGILSMILVY